MESISNKSYKSISLQQKSEMDLGAESLEYSRTVQELFIKDQYFYNGVLSLYGHSCDDKICGIRNSIRRDFVIKKKKKIL